MPTILEPAVVQPQPLAHSTGVSYLPEECPFWVLITDITHRCNMACKNCYLPNRTLPDMDIEWLARILARLPRSTNIRLVGAEPTLRRDLPQIISRVRRLGHQPDLLTNGLKLADRNYVRLLRQAGMLSCYLSMNGGFEDAFYEAIDGQRCAAQKVAALDNLLAERRYIGLGVILVRGVNESVPAVLFEKLRGRRGRYALHLRSVGSFGRYISDTRPYSLNEMRELASAVFGAEAVSQAEAKGPSSLDFVADGVQVQLTEWPDLGSRTRGRLTPEGCIEPFFEHVMANEGGY
jgi:cyclic pyranopterin phosphate synthase